MKNIKVIELFAGVGGFRVGLENSDKNFFSTVWSNQWEPSTKKQHASEVYQNIFGDKGHHNGDINEIPGKKISKHQLLCGGFPCQTFSVMRPKNKAEGLNGVKGDKGILFWEIHRIAKEHKTPYLLLENVDRLLISPGSQKGKDFAVILKSLMELNYIVEWRVINAAEYGFPQKRRRTFIFAYQNDSKVKNEVFKENSSKKDLLLNDLLMSNAFPINDFDEKKIKETNLTSEIYDISKDFNIDNKDKKPFGNCGVAFGGVAYSIVSEPKYNGKYINLKEVLLDEKNIDESFFADDNESYNKWEKAKGKIHKERINKVTGEKYIFKGGAIPFPDKLNSPARTIITSEGGKSASRTTHIIKPNKRLRRLHPIELERLNGFPDNHTLLDGVSNVKRGFLMGNALVTGVVTTFGNTLKDFLKK